MKYERKMIMENPTLIIGSIAEEPKTVKTGYAAKYIFTVIPDGKDRPVHIEAEAPGGFADRFKKGDSVEIIGRPFTRKIYINGKAAILPYLQAQTVSRRI